MIEVKEYTDKITVLYILSIYLPNIGDVRITKVYFEFRLDTFDYSLMYKFRLFL